MSCNLEWDEIKSLLRGTDLKAEDHLDITLRIFKIKLNKLIRDFKYGDIFWKISVYVWTIEFQKRGLPHAHILLFMHPFSRPRSSNDIDKLISAQIPDKRRRPKLYAAVEKFMVHGPCGKHKKNILCMMSLTTIMIIDIYLYVKLLGDYMAMIYRSLTYCEFLRKFVWKDNISIWIPRKQGFSIGRLAHMYKELFEDILFEQRRIHQLEELQLSDEQIMNLTLAKLEDRMQSNERFLKEFECMSYPLLDDVHVLEDRLVLDELNFDHSLLTQQYIQSLNTMTDEQRTAFDIIIDSVNNDRGGFFFLYGCRGTGKTFIRRTISAYLRSGGNIVLYVASNGITSLLLPNGRTVHSRFKIPLSINEDSICNIKQGTPLSKLIYLPFGGKVVILGGNFRQILPVIPMGSRQDIVQASISSSYLWQFCKVLKLLKNMRLTAGGTIEVDNDLKEFAQWLIQIGYGLAGDSTDGDSKVVIPKDILINHTSDGFQNLVTFVYPDLLLNLDNMITSRSA
ncbi:uncharacterized protein [Arachis hypogaea]|uniref:uncharacterized protein n=1 Tax=Arachis hypogaea TaxID=3818 RepID=UPI003B21E2CB